MEILSSLEPRSLIRLSHEQVARLFQQLAADHPVETVNDQISYLIHRESLPATVYAIWLPIALRQAPDLLRQALLDHESRGIRRAAIAAISRGFHHCTWRSTWDRLGGAEGIPNLLRELSVVDVDGVVKAITRCRNQPERAEIARCMEDLFVRLEQQADNSRSLLQQTDRLLPLCSADFVTPRIVSVTGYAETVNLVQRLAPHQAPLLRKIATDTVEVPRDLRAKIVEHAKTEMVRSLEPYTPVHVASWMSDPGIAFCLDFFHVMSEDKRHGDDGKFWVSRYIDHIFLVAIHRKTCFDDILVLLNASIPLSVQFSKSTSLDIELVRQVIRFWSIALCGKVGAATNRVELIESHPSRPESRHKEALERLICDTLHDNQDERLNPVSETVPHRDFAKLVKDLLSEVAPDARLPLLQLLCARSKFLAYDLSSSVPSQREKNLVPVWPLSTHALLPAKDSELLFTRGLKIYGCAEFIPAPDIVDRHYAGLSWTEQCRIKAQWAREIPGDYSVTLKILEEMKSRAHREREATARRIYARTVLIVARECYSLSIFHDALRWAKRFIRDPNVFPDLLKIMQGPRMADLLSCVKGPESRLPTSLSELSVAVEQSHSILDTIQDLIQQYHKEPGALKSATEFIPSLLASITYQRMWQCKKRSHKGLGTLGTPTELADVLLQPLIPVIMKYEWIGISEAEVKISWPNIKGILNRMDSIQHPSDEILGFMDQVAQQRDQLIQAERHALNPDVLSLGTAWPRGVPVQDLLPNALWAMEAMRRPHAAPFVTGRIMDVLFAPEEIVTSIPPKNVEPILSFVDSLEYALQAYTGYDFLTKDTVSRMKDVWDHYARILAPHTEHLHAFRHWFERCTSHFCRRVRRGKRKILPPRDVPTATYLTDTVLPDEVLEWNPQPLTIDGVREVPVIVLHCRTSAKILPWSTLTTSEARCGLLGAWPYRDYHPMGAKKMALGSREAIGLSALMMLETFIKKRVLSVAFPEDHVRYPPLYLEGQFVNRVNSDPPLLLRIVPQVLRYFMATVPARLQRDICSSLLDTLAEMKPDDRNYSSILRCTVQLIKLLSDSHKPEYAVGLVLRFLREFPQESSYHRHLRLPSLANRLSPDGAQVFAQQMADLVSSSWKVTTAKQLAQLLNQGHFLASTTSLGILHNLVMTSTHIDARVEAVSAIFALLERNAAKDSTYSLLKSIAHIAAGPSERTPTTEADWLAAENGTGSLPIVAYGLDKRPILSMFGTQAFYKVPDTEKQAYVDTILLPLFEESTANHTRWMKIFLAPLDLPQDMNIEDLRFGAFDPAFVNVILHHWWKYLPASFLEVQRKSSLAYTHHHTFEQITSALAKQDSEFRQTNAGKHWVECLELYRETNPFVHLHMIMEKRPEDTPSNRLTIEILAGEFCIRAAAVARHPVVYNAKDGRFKVNLMPVTKAMARLGRSRTGGYGKRASRYHLVQTTLERVVDDMECLRVSGQQVSGNGDPIILPSRLELQALLLPALEYNPDTETPVREFAERVFQLVHLCVDDQTHLAHFDCLKAVIQGVGYHHLQECAVVLGDVEGGSLYDCLRVRLTRILFDNMSKMTILLDEKINAIIAQWKGSESEYIRLQGWRMDGRF